MNSTNQRILFIAGTRPEIIKLAPVITAMKHSDDFNPVLMFTNQHSDLGKDFLREFGLVSDVEVPLDLGNTPRLAGLHSQFTSMTAEVCGEVMPDLVIVQGDTISAAGGATGAFLAGVAVGHVEAGLRTFNLHDPFPEEWARRVISLCAKWHFAPTEQARDNLLDEGVPSESIFVTGNTGIDSVRLISEEVATIAGPFGQLPEVAPGQPIILITMHRRELITNERELDSFLESALRKFDDAQFVAINHPNGYLSSSIERIGKPRNLMILPPQNYHAFIRLLSSASVVISDSGGVQEEATYLNVPLLILRENTERSEALLSPNSHRSSLSPDALSAIETLLNSHGNQGAAFQHSFGDGFASERILAALRKDPC